MSSAFISYSTQDEALARRLYQALSNVGVKTFLASISIQPGMNWTQEIFNNLRASDWVFFVASKAACSSHAVQQEIGASLIQEKHIIPILVDIAPEELPGWVGQHQAIDARHGGERLSETIAAIGQKVREQKFWSGVILGGIAVALLSGGAK